MPTFHNSVYSQWINSSCSTFYLLKKDHIRSKLHFMLTSGVCSSPYTDIGHIWLMYLNIDTVVGWSWNGLSHDGRSETWMWIEDGEAGSASGHESCQDKETWRFSCIQNMIFRFPMLPKLTVVLSKTNSSLCPSSPVERHCVWNQNPCFQTWCNQWWRYRWVWWTPPLGSRREPSGNSLGESAVHSWSCRKSKGQRSVHLLHICFLWLWAAVHSCGSRHPSSIQLHFSISRESGWALFELSPHQLCYGGGSARRGVEFPHSGRWSAQVKSTAGTRWEGVWHHSVSWWVFRHWGRPIWVFWLIIKGLVQFRIHISW